MRPNIFKAKIAKRINKALGKQMLPAVLIKIENVKDVNDSTKMTVEEVSYKARGFTEITDVYTKSGSLIARNAYVISILGGSLPDNISPIPGDKITIEGSTKKIAEDGVSRDPAGAIFQCQAF